MCQFSEYMEYDFHLINLIIRKSDVGSEVILAWEIFSLVSFPSDLKASSFLTCSFENYNFPLDFSEPRSQL